MKPKRSRVGISYFFKEGIGSIFKHSFMSFASVSIIVACLLIMGTFALIAYNIDSFISELESENQIVAYVDDSYSRDEALNLEEQLKKVDNVESVEFITRESAMESFEQEYDDDLFEGIDSTVFRDRYIVYMKDIAKMEDTQKGLSNVTGIVKVTAHLDIAQGFITVRMIASVVSLIIIAILFVVSLFIMSNTIKLTTVDRKEEIAIMKMVGATNAFIRWPFVFEGLFLGLLGSLVAYILQWGLYQVIAERISSMSLVSIINVIPFGMFAIPLVIIFVAVGLIVGIFGSLVAIRNYLKV